MLDEVPVAFVIPNSPREELIDDILLTCKDKLADFKVPKEVRLVQDESSSFN